MRRKAAKLTRWAARRGFAALVASGGVVAAWVAWRVEVPIEIPAFALQAAPVYRLEVGTAVFSAIYFASMAVVLALNNRAFSEIGTSGVKVQDLVDTNDRALRDQQTSVEELTIAIAALDVRLGELREGGSERR